MEALGYRKVKDLYAWKYDSLAGMGDPTLAPRQTE